MRFNLFPKNVTAQKCSFGVYEACEICAHSSRLIHHYFKALIFVDLK